MFETRSTAQTWGEGSRVGRKCHPESEVERTLDVPEVPEFLQMLSEMGANLWACKMSVDMMDLEDDDLFDEVADVINVGEFMELSEGAQIVFV
ncbi:MAG: DsrE/DsrF/DrsH-like family protein [Acidimicrobiales bacterium]|nr:DsrE/DsrF/DrsH-like family protein [Acidimicrobiales bacterium]